MMAVIRSTLKIPIDRQRELSVIIEDRNSHVVFEINEISSDKYTEQKTFKLSPNAAMKLAMFLAGITSMKD